MVSLHAFVLAAALAASNDATTARLQRRLVWPLPLHGADPGATHAGRLSDAPCERRQEPGSGAAIRHRTDPLFCAGQPGREVQRVVGATSFEQLVQMFQQVGVWAGATGCRQHARAIARSFASAISAGSPTAQHSRRHESVGGRSVNGPGAAMPPSQTSTTSLPDQQLTPAQRLALQATVRLRVSDDTGQSKGTGTIIDVHGDEALIVTCGHIFRESQGQGEILVDLFAPGSHGPLPGHLLLYECDQRDFGLVSIRLNVPVTPVKVATTTYHPRPGEPIFSVGCDHGADPTVRPAPSLPSTVTSGHRTSRSMDIRSRAAAVADCSPAMAESSGSAMPPTCRTIGGSTRHCRQYTWLWTESGSVRFTCSRIPINHVSQQHPTPVTAAPGRRRACPSPCPAHRLDPHRALPS